MAKKAAKTIASNGTTKRVLRRSEIEPFAVSTVELFDKTRTPLSKLTAQYYRAMLRLFGERQEIPAEEANPLFDKFLEQLKHTEWEIWKQEAEGE